MSSAGTRLFAPTIAIIALLLGSCTASPDHDTEETVASALDIASAPRDYINPVFAQFILDGVNTVHITARSKEISYDYRMARGHPINATGRMRVHQPVMDTTDTYDFIYVNGSLFLRTMDHETAKSFIGGSDIPVIDALKIDAQADSILGKWVIGTPNRYVNLLDEVELMVFSSSACSGFSDDDRVDERETAGVKSALFRNASGNELELALAGKHLPVRALRMGPSPLEIRFSDYNAPLHTEAPAGAIDMAKL